MHERGAWKIETKTKRTPEDVRLVCMRVCTRSLILPRCAEHAEVGFVTPLCILLSGGEELVCLFRELLCYGSEADFTLEVVLELIPLRLFGVELERVLAFCLSLRLSPALWAALPPLRHIRARIRSPRA